MSQPNNVWNRGGKQSNSNTSRTPQNRSSTASPIQPNPSSQTTKQESNNTSRSQTPVTNAWTTPRNPLVSGGSNGPSTSEQTHVSAHGFNVREVKQFLSRGPIPASYKPQTSGGSAPWGGGAAAVQPLSMSTGQAFFPNLNKQIAAFENGV